MAVQSVFVYGTLKQHEERGGMWPFRPTRILPARLRGHLFDLGDYPALVLPGDDWITGECWSFAKHEITRTLEVLDEIEEYSQRDDDLYRRVVIECEAVSGQMHAAYTYVFAQPDQLPDELRMPAAPHGVVEWSRR